MFGRSQRFWLGLVGWMGLLCSLTWAMNSPLWTLLVWFSHLLLLHSRLKCLSEYLLCICHMFGLTWALESFLWLPLASELYLLVRLEKKKDIPLCFQAHGLSSCASILYNVGFSEEPNGANYQLNNGDIHTLFSNRRSSRLLQPIRMKQWPFNKRLHLAWLILRDTQAHLACVKWLVRKYWQLETIPRATKQWSGR